MMIKTLTPGLGTLGLETLGLGTFGLETPGLGTPWSGDIPVRGHPVLWGHPGLVTPRLGTTSLRTLVPSYVLHHTNDYMFS